MRAGRTRLAVGLISLAIVALELALMRAMSLMPRMKLRSSSGERSCLPLSTPVPERSASSSRAHVSQP